jgi:predicted DCC family thiol-disulfide oxidoreductase YuxK
MNAANAPDKKASADDDWSLVYDQQCPACDLYCHLVCRGDPGGRTRLVDARGNPEAIKDITAQGFDIDQGMVLQLNGRYYYGAEAMAKLALMVGSSGIFNRLNFWIFRSRRRSEWLYPVLRACRNILLKLLRRTKINNLGLPGNERF